MDENPNTQSGIVEKVKQRIDDLVAENLANKDIYLLSKLGLDLGEDRKAIEQLGLTIREFVQSHTSYRLGNYGPHNNIFGILKSGVDVSSVTSNARKPRYKRQFWAAFVSNEFPTTRYLNIDTLHFSDLEETASRGGGRTLVVPPEYQTPWKDPEKTTRVEERIRDWLTKNNVDIAPLLDAPESRLGSKRQSLLDELILTLNEDQLRKVSLTLDVVNALRKRHL